MKKFPVISESGNEYKIKIAKTWGANYVEVFVYKKRRLMGIPYYRQLNGGFLDNNVYYLIDYDFDYVKIAKDEINRLEKKWAEKERRSFAHIMGVHQFEEWDGDMRNE